MNTGAPRSGTLHVTKECSQYTGEPGSFLAPSPLRTSMRSRSARRSSTPRRSRPRAVLDSDIVVNTPTGDAAYGHVVLDGATQSGMVKLAGGTGQLAQLAAGLVVRAPDRTHVPLGRAVLVLGARPRPGTQNPRSRRKRRGRCGVSV